MGAGLGLGAALGSPGVGLTYQLATAWTFPYHHHDLASPLWQINLPFLINGAHLPPVWATLFAPRAVPGPEQVGGYWGALALGAALALAALALAGLRGRPQALRRSALVAFGAALVTGATLLAMGIASNPITPALRAGLKRGHADGAALSAPARSVVRQAVLEARLYEGYLSDVQGSTFTPQDAMWRDAGYPGTNRWCAAAGVAARDPGQDPRGP